MIYILVPRGPPYHQAADSSTDSTSSDEEATKSAATGSGQSFSRPRRPGAGSRHRRPHNRYGLKFYKGYKNSGFEEKTTKSI